MAYSQPSTQITGYLVVASDWNELVGNDIALRAEPRYPSIEVFPPGANCTTGDGKVYIHIPPLFNTGTLVYVHAEHIAAGAGGTATSIQVRNVTDAVNMLSTALTIDSTETGSDTAATAAVIDTANDDLATNDLIAIDIDALDSSTIPQGLYVTLGLEVPA